MNESRDTTTLFRKPTEDVNYPHSTSVTVILSTILCTIIIASVAGNILVSMAIIRYRHMRKTGNFFLASLAVSDLIVALLVMPFAVMNDVFGRWPFSAEFCNIWISFDVLSATASILHLSAVSIDRYVQMSDPFAYDTKMTSFRCGLIIACIWVASVLISFLPIHTGWHQMHLQENPEGLSDLYDSSTTPNTNSTNPGTLYFSEEWRAGPNTGSNTCALDISGNYALVSSCISFYIPGAVMIVVYTLIYRLANKHRRSIQRDTMMLQTPREDEVDSAELRHSTTAKSRIKENKALFTLGLITGLFLLSWIPFFTVNLINGFCHCVPSVLFQLLTWLGYFNSAQNPIIYSIFNSDFREAFRDLLFCSEKGKKKGSISRIALIKHACCATQKGSEDTANPNGDLPADGDAMWNELDNLFSRCQKEDTAGKPDNKTDNQKRDSIHKDRTEGDSVHIENGSTSVHTARKDGLDTVTTSFDSGCHVIVKANGGSQTIENGLCRSLDEGSECTPCATEILP